MSQHLRFGCFMSPLHPPGQDPHILLEQDFRLTEAIDRLNYDELWIGEHHSAGWGTIPSPEIFIAAAAERTERLRFATGVMALPYHHPLTAAVRAVQLDHLTRGRFILGVGAGSVALDMHMLGIPAGETRARTEASAEVIQQLLRGERVTRDDGWFTLREGSLQLLPFSRSGLEMTVASAATPFGMTLAGRLGVSALSHVAPPWGTVRPGQSMGVENLAAQWTHLEVAAAAAGTRPDRTTWRLVVPMHIAETREEALADIEEGWLRQRRELWIETFGVPMPQSAQASRRAFQSTIEGDGIIAGSPDDAVAAVRRLQETTGGFGCLLLSVTDWAPFERTLRSLDLFARYVAPSFTGSADALQRSNRAAADGRTKLQEAHNSARREAIERLAEPASVPAAV